MALRPVERLLSSDHFSIDGTLIAALASMKSFRPEDGSGEPPGPGRHGERDFRTETRSNETRASTTDPDPPAHAVVLSLDEKSRIQAIARTQAPLSMKLGQPKTRTHDYKRHGTTTLFAALDVLEGKVIGRCMQRHRHQEFIRFLNAVEAAVPAGKVVHATLDNDAVHKHPKVRAWLDRHPRWSFHFTPTSLAHSPAPSWQRSPRIRPGSSRIPRPDRRI